jgi:HD-like signal output (HDOD) protein/prolyl-tRNA editing enzyme YbaK/EbsC (Cys-tRNA(Pro) deacylase)
MVMNLPNPIQHFLDQHQLPYRLISCRSNETRDQASTRLTIRLDQTVRTVLLREADGLLMAVLPYDYVIDFSILCQLRGSELEPLHGAETVEFFRSQGCKGNSRPPFPSVFGITAIVDTSLAGQQELFLESGNDALLISMRSNDFSKLLDQARWEQFAIPVKNLDFPINQNFSSQNLISLTHRYTPGQSQGTLESITELPTLAPSVERIMALQSDPEPSMTEIIQLIEQDAMHAARIVYWARAPLHHFHSPVDSLETAIKQVLGIKNTLNLLLGASMAEIFEVTVEGAVGLQAVWRHSIYCAALVRELVKALPDPLDINPNTAYLCGLLHDFGYLVLGHALPAQFFLLNQFLAVNRHVPISEIERYVMGVEHWQIGAWLMQSWNLPEEVIATMRWHHGEDSTHPHSQYSNLVLIANRLLHYFGLGEEHNNRLPALAMFTLGLSRDQAMLAVNQIHAATPELEQLCTILPILQNT